MRDGDVEVLGGRRQKAGQKISYDYIAYRKGHVVICATPQNQIHVHAHAHVPYSYSSPSSQRQPPPGQLEKRERFLQVEDFNATSTSSTASIARVGFNFSTTSEAVCTHLLAASLTPRRTPSLPTNSLLYSSNSNDQRQALLFVSIPTSPSHPYLYPPLSPPSYVHSPLEEGCLPRNKLKRRRYCWADLATA